MQESNPKPISLNKPGYVKEAFSPLMYINCFHLHFKSRGLCFYPCLEYIISPLCVFGFLLRTDPGTRSVMEVVKRVEVGSDPWRHHGAREVRQGRGASNNKQATIMGNLGSAPLGTCGDCREHFSEWPP